MRCCGQIGGCLVKQEQAEAKTNVDKRIEFISSELFVLSLSLPLQRLISKENSGKVEAQIKVFNEQMEQTKMEVSVPSLSLCYRRD